LLCATESKYSIGWIYCQKNLLVKISYSSST